MPDGIVATIRNMIGSAQLFERTPIEIAALFATDEIEMLRLQRDLFRKAAEAYERGSFSEGDRLLEEARRG